MDIRIFSPDKQELEVIIDSMVRQGFEYGEIYSRRRYFLFGAVMYYAVLESMTIVLPPIKPGGIITDLGGEIVIPYPILNRMKKGFSSGISAQELADAINSTSFENTPTRLEYLEGLEKQYADNEEFELAAQTRDQINELKEQNK